MKTRNSIALQSTGVESAPMSSSSKSSPKLLILPEDRSPDARICTLTHPRTSTPSRYLFDPEKGVYEFTKVAAPRSTYRSWLIAGQSPKIASIDEAEHAKALNTTDNTQDATNPSSRKCDDAIARPISNGYVVKNAELLVATPIDALFLLLPSMANSPIAKSSDSAGIFLSADDLLEKISETCPNFHNLLDHERTRQLMEERMQIICDTVDAGGENMYRLNDDKLLSELLAKARSMVAKGLPVSIEMKFVRKALETPVMGIMHEETPVSDTNPPPIDTLRSESMSSDTVDSQSSAAISVSTASASTEVTIPDIHPPTEPDRELHHLMRLRTAFSYMLSAYVPAPLAARLSSTLASNKSPIDFKPLDERLAYIAKMRAEALAARSLGDFSRKRSMYEEDDASETRAEKKRRKEEEEKKKKASETRGIRDLKKVDTTGMKKMSDFFGKGATVKKKVIT